MTSKFSPNSNSDATKFCSEHPVDEPNDYEGAYSGTIHRQGTGAWCLQYRFDYFDGTVDHREDDQPGENDEACESGDSDESDAAGVIRVNTTDNCKQCCLMSDLPFIAGKYGIQKSAGVYYEVKIKEMGGIIALGTACRPAPQGRLPGFDRLSAALHLDDLCTYYENPQSGQKYAIGISRIAEGDVVGCGYHFSTGALFFTYNGVRLPDAFTGIYFPHGKVDVFAAIGMQGSNNLEVNFGYEPFKWAEGNGAEWKVDTHLKNGLTGQH
ncbi:uncharacterized protein LAESUDRAFT_647340 [Laetiporus sulphureus 93-53]|uniref:B30.2/SPRY domain-containing protein n=1 Tax=Laetiporus sulphureus 93-53 TaxID=1314785 RepID=A0A165FLW3_9APHY|nr:uncharacterized protein LAESUDRAFT_647340 [Laetiporus sulphureus 93-53]KZT09168.1 hypothetical protein LAESUDRAFT_647340 [Laetiporus sulphureus 93-53]